MPIPPQKCQHAHDYMVIEEDHDTGVYLAVEKYPSGLLGCRSMVGVIALAANNAVGRTRWTVNLTNPILTHINGRPC